MCNQYKAKQMIGQNMAVAAIKGDVPFAVTLDSGYGNILGFSVGRSFTDQQLGQINLSLKAGSTDLLVNVPLTQLIPDASQRMWPCRKPITKGTQITGKLNINVVGLDATVPIPLVFHTDGGIVDCDGDNDQ
jgi:hypothetical protein